MPGKASRRIAWEGVLPCSSLSDIFEQPCVKGAVVAQGFARIGMRAAFKVLGKVTPDVLRDQRSSSMIVYAAGVGVWGRPRMLGQSGPLQHVRCAFKHSILEESSHSIQGISTVQKTLR
jgi:hypothetical protein